MLQRKEYWEEINPLLAKWKNVNDSLCRECDRSITVNMARHLRLCHTTYVCFWRCPVSTCPLWFTLELNGNDHIERIHREGRGCSFYECSGLMALNGTASGHSSTSVRRPRIADIRGGRDKHNSSVRLYHLLTWRHTPHPHCPPSLGGNIFPQSLHLSHRSDCTITYIFSKHQSMFINIAGLRTPASDFGLWASVRSISLDFT